MKKKIAGALLLSALGMPVWADGDESLFFSDLPVVASVSRLPQRLADAPASVTVVDRDMIRASGARSLNDVLRLVPGFQTFAHSDVAARVNYHGVSDDNDFSPRVQVLVDGRSLHSPLFRNGMNWGLAPVALEDIERIEVVRGSNTVSYGTNAFMGVVNIVTLPPPLVRGLSVSASRGNQGVRDHTVRGGGRFGEQGHFRLTLQETKDDGLDDSWDWQDRFLNRRFDARFDYQLGMADLLEVGFGRVEGRFRRGRLDTDVTPFVIDPEDPFRNLRESSTWLQTRWLRTLADGGDVSLRYTFNEDRGDEAYSDPTRDPGFRRVNYSGDVGRRNEIELTHHLRPSDATRLTWGMSWRHDTVSSDTMLRDRGTVSRQVRRAFANGEWKPATRLTVNVGASSENDSLSGNHLSPRASVALHLTPENTLRVGYAQAWRTPSLVAYNANYRDRGVLRYRNDQIGNRGLEAEELDTWEIGYLGDWRDWRMSLDVRVFREKLRDRILLLRPGAGRANVPRSEQNVQDIDIDGYEFQWRWQPFEKTRLVANHARIRAEAGLSSNGERIAAIPGSNLATDRTGAYFALAENSAPRHSSSLLWMQKLPYGLEFSLAHYRVGEAKWTRNTEVQAYRRTDARLAYPFRLAGQRGELAYTVQSLDGAHEEQRSARSDEPNQRTVDRRHWVSLRLDF